MQEVLTRLAAQEKIVERGLASFVEVGNALMRIRDDRLFLEAGHEDFTAYLRSKSWGLDRTRAYQVIDAAGVSKIVDTPNEAQARELAPLLRKSTPDAVRQVYAEVVEETNGKPTAKLIREKVRAFLPSKTRKPEKKGGQNGGDVGRSAPRVLSDFIDPDAKENPRTQLVEWFSQGRLVSQLLNDGGKIEPRSEEDKQALLRDVENMIALARSIKRRLK